MVEHQELDPQTGNIITYHFYIMLFSAVEQTHCALGACDSGICGWLSLALVVVIWLVPCETAAVSAHVLCTPYNHAPAYGVTSFKVTCSAYVCLAVTCHLHFWQNNWDLLCATVVTQGLTDSEIRVSTEGWPWRRKFSCFLPLLLGLERLTFSFSHEFPTLYHWAIPVIGCRTWRTWAWTANRL